MYPIKIKSKIKDQSTVAQWAATTMEEQMFFHELHVSSCCDFGWWHLDWKPQWGMGFRCSLDSSVWVLIHFLWKDQSLVAILILQNQADHPPAKQVHRQWCNAKLIWEASVDWKTSDVLWVMYYRGWLTTSLLPEPLGTCSLCNKSSCQSKGGQVGLRFLVGDQW